MRSGPRLSTTTRTTLFRAAFARVTSLVILVAVVACQPRSETGDDCRNGRDDDGDDLFDCEDPSCALTPQCGSCGDGDVDVGEICDDGNLIDGDGCDAHCLDEACGNGELDDGEECDDGNRVPADGCSAACVIDFCGDRRLQNADEECEDGNRLDGDGCSSSCEAEPLDDCGNFEIEFDPVTFEQLEECDDGNRESGDFCDSQCRREFCGDAVTQPTLNEQCDDADPFRPAECIGCRIPECGDRFFNPGEQCDDGNNVDGDGCTADCRQEFCGDSIVQPGIGEQCDDGINTGNCGDGCCFCRFE